MASEKLDAEKQGCAECHRLVNHAIRCSHWSPICDAVLDSERGRMAQATAPAEPIEDGTHKFVPTMLDMTTCDRTVNGKACGQPAGAPVHKVSEPPDEHLYPHERCARCGKEFETRRRRDNHLCQVCASPASIEPEPSAPEPPARVPMGNEVSDRSRLIQIAGAIAMHVGFVSPYADDHSRATPRSVIKQAEDQDTRLKDWAYELRQIADRMSASTTSPLTPEGLSAIDPIGEAVNRLWNLTRNRDGYSRMEIRGVLESLIDAAPSSSLQSTARKVAEKITNELLTTGSGRKGDHLEIAEGVPPDSVYLAGWCEAAIKSRVESIIESELSTPAGTETKE